MNDITHSSPPVDKPLLPSALAIVARLLRGFASSANAALRRRGRSDAEVSKDPVIPGV